MATPSTTPVSAPATIDPTKVASHTPTAAMAFKIESGTSRVQYLNMLIYGPFGAGKTTLLASAADVDDMSDVLMLDIESGRMTIEDNPRIQRPENIDSIRISNFSQMAKVHEFLMAHCRLRDDPSKEQQLKELEARFRGCTPDEITKPRRYRTVIIDSLSELDTMVIYELLGFRTDMKLSDALADNDMEVAQFAEYKKNNQMLQLIVRAYRDLPINALFACQVQFTQDEMKRMFYAPQMTGKLAKQVQGFMDIVGFLQPGQLQEGAKEAPRRLWIQPAGKFDAKNRRAAYKESFLDNPVMKNVWDIAKVSQTAGNSTNQQTNKAK